MGDTSYAPDRHHQHSCSNMARVILCLLITTCLLSVVYSAAIDKTKARFDRQGRLLGNVFSREQVNAFKFDILLKVGEFLGYVAAEYLMPTLGIARHIHHLG